MQWIHDERTPTENLDSLRSVVWHLGGAWARREDPSVILMHHADLSRDLEGEMRRLAEALSISVARQSWGALVQAATFGRMRAHAAALVPDERLGLFTDNRAFFRSGAPRQWVATLTENDLEGYDTLLRSLAPTDLTAWLQHGRAHVDRDHRPGAEPAT